MNRVEKDLFNLLGSRELDPREREKIAAGIEKYLLEKGGIVITASCQDGILLVGVNPDCEQNIFQAFYRIALLGVGKFKDYKEIHNEILISAFRTGLRPSKADVDVNEIIKKIAEELEERLNFKTRRPPYKTNLIVVELGFEIEEDVIEIINFEGIMTKVKYAATVETPMVLATFEKVIKPVKDEKGGVKKDKKGKIQFEKALEMKPVLKYPVGDALGNLVKKVCTDDYVWTIKEAALFIGLIIRSLGPRGGKFQMGYLDRGMLRKTKTEKRRFHHILSWVTNPKSYKPLESWRDWKKFVAPVKKSIERGEIYPELKDLVELLDIFESKKISKKERKIIEKIEKGETSQLIESILGVERKTPWK